MRKEKQRKSKRIKYVWILLAILLVLYIGLTNLLVETCLVPSFMRKLDAFSQITEQSYAQQVQTDDLKENSRTMWDETKEWFASVEKQKLAAASSDGYQLIAVEFTPEQKEQSHRWALVLHGYTGWKEEMYPFAKWYQEQGYHVLVPDLRCQGESEGDYIGMGYTDSEDCLLWLAYILKQDPDAEIVLHGQSMGAATALILTGRCDYTDMEQAEVLKKHICAVVSDSSYTDAYTMFGDKITEWFHLPPFPLVDSTCLMLRLRGGYDIRKASAIEAVRKSTVPTLFIHGQEDAMISVGMAEKLYAAAGCPKELLLVEGAGHGQTQDKDPKTYFGTIERFLEPYITK